MTFGLGNSMGPFGQLVVSLWLLFVLAAAHGHDLGGYGKWRGGRHANGTIICPEDPHNQPFYNCESQDEWYVWRPENLVCGSDGVTYANECLLEAAFCDGINVTKVHAGKCEAPPCGTPCPEYFLPVCGRGHTYDNPCEFDQAKACEGIDAEMRAGRCTCSGPMPLIYDPVCGSDGKTYGNMWELEYASKCVAQGMYMVAHGECERPACDDNCPDEGSMVCGSDNKEYRNICELKRANVCAEKRFGNEVFMKRKGECPPDWPPPSSSPRLDSEFE